MGALVLVVVVMLVMFWAPTARTTTAGANRSWNFILRVRIWEGEVHAKAGNAGDGVNAREWVKSEQRAAE